MRPIQKYAVCIAAVVVLVAALGVFAGPEQAATGALGAFAVAFVINVGL